MHLDRSVIELFIERAAETPHKIFATFDGEPLTFGQLDKRSDSMASLLAAKNVLAGDRAAVMLRNSLDCVATVFALAKAGIAWVPINAQQRGTGLKYVLEKCDPTIVIAESDLKETIVASGAICSGSAFVWRNGPENSLEAFLDTDQRFETTPPKLGDCASIMFTSGTTGNPKGVIVSHQMLRLAAESVLTVSGAKDGDKFFVWEPLYHIGGAQLLALPILNDIQLAMVSRFSASRFWGQIGETSATHIHYLGGILQILLKQPVSAAERSHSVRVAWGAGCIGETYLAAKQRFGFDIRECFGMTEASSITSFADASQQGSVGKPVPWFSVTIRDENDNVVVSGTRGEIVVESSVPHAISVGYFRNEEATAKTMKNGRLYTGDAGHIDDSGLLYFHGRQTDSIRCRGENVSAWEVEQVVVGNPDVEDCAAVGVAADIGEQEIMLFVKAKIGSLNDPAALSQWLVDKLAPFQLPRFIVYVDEFERTPSLRILKHKLPRERKSAWDRTANQKFAR